MKAHARLQLGLHTTVQAQDCAFAPVRRERNTDRVTGAFLERIREAGAIDDRLASDVRGFAGLAGAQRIQRCLKGFLTNLFHFLSDRRWRA